MNEPGAGPLADLRVIDLATVIAGPGCARYLGDFGADVVKVERPEGDTARDLGWRDPTSGESLWWRVVGRNKRTIVLDLKDPADLDTMLELCDSADVLVENFRPGTLERLGLDPERLHERNPRLVVTRVSGFGQTGPSRDRPAFATQAEALSGFAAINGEPDGQPLLPPIALTDEVAALVAAFATLVAVHSGVGQVVDVNLIESMLQLMGPLVPLYGLLGETQQRLGAGIPYTVPRNTYRCADGRWVAVSSSAESVAQRVLDLIGLGGDERFVGLRRPHGAPRRDRRGARCLDGVTNQRRGARRVRPRRGRRSAGTGHGGHLRRPARRSARVDHDRRRRPDARRRGAAVAYPGTRPLGRPCARRGRRRDPGRARRLSAPRRAHSEIATSMRSCLHSRAESSAMRAWSSSSAEENACAG